MKSLLPAGWKKPKGYANGILAEGRLVFVAGQVGWDENEQFPSHELAAQVRQALKNMVAVLREAKAGPEHVARMTWYITDRQEYLRCLREVGEAYRETMGTHYPAMSMVEVSALIESDAKVEIEATAVIPHGN